MRRGARSTFFIGAAALCVTIGLGGTAFAGPAGGIKGDPQPNTKPFRLASEQSSPASIAFEPDGSLVAAFDATTKKAEVCVLDRGRRSCAHTLDMRPPTSASSDTWDAAGPFLLVPSANHVVLVADTCCDAEDNDETLMYSSTDGGRAFGPLTNIGSVVVAGAVLVGNQIALIGNDFPSGVQVESVPVGAAGPPAGVASISQGESDVNDLGIGSYRGGVLAGFDNDGTIWQTFVKYAPKGKDFNSSSSYTKVITINNQKLIAVSGTALLTWKQTGNGAIELRLFNGKNFGAAHTVPGTSGGGPEWWGLDQSPNGHTHVFTERSTTGYDLVEYSTSNGTSWSKRNLGSALNSTAFTAGLDSRGTGLILGSGNNLVNAYPILQSQSVSFSLKSSNIGKGKSTTATGKGNPAGTGRVIRLQVERSGKWFDVAKTTEKSSGSFKFTIKGTSAGTFRYRAVAADLAGYLLFGYSTGRTLRVS